MAPIAKQTWPIAGVILRLSCSVFDGPADETARTLPDFAENAFRTKDAGTFCFVTDSSLE